MSKTKKDATEMIEELLGEGSRTMSNADRSRAAKIVEGKTLDEGSRTISNSDRERAKDISKLLNKNKKPKSELPSYRRNMGGTMDYNMGGTMNYSKGGTPSKTISDKDAMAMAKEAMGEGPISAQKIVAILGEDSKTISDADRARADKISKLLNKNKKPKSELPSYRRNRNMGGTMKNYRRGGVDIEFRDEEGSRLSISMERQEDAGHSPSEADFDKQHSLAAEGIMEVGADVTTIQGHNSRASLGETEGVRGTGAMIRGTKFRGSF
jgi:hypothetical protein